MKSIARILLPLFCLIWLSCSRDKNLTPQIEVAVTGDEITFEQEASTLSFSYSVRNPVAGNAITARLADESWVKIVQITDDLIKLSVSSNESSLLRTTTLTLKYPGADDKIIQINQKGEGMATFKFMLSKETYNGVTVDVVPSDKNIMYTWNLIEKKDFDKYDSDSEIVNKMIDGLKEDLAEKKEFDPEASIYDLLVRSDDKRRIVGLDQNKAYVLIAIGLDPENLSPTTELAKFEFVTKPFSIQNNSKFSISFSDITTTSFAFTIQPTDNSVRYFYGICPQKLVQEKGKEQIAEEFIRMRDHGEYDWSRRDALNQGVVSKNTEDMDLSSPLTPNSEYAIIAFGISDLGERTTEVASEMCRTKAVEKINLTFDITLVKQTEQGAILQVKPSKKEPPYMIGCIQADQYAKYEGKDDEFMQYVIEMGNVETRRGDCTLDKTHKLISDTDYICFAFGYDGGPTTGLTVFRFHTGKTALDGAAKMRLVKVEAEPWSKDVQYAVVSFYIEPENGAEHWRAQVFRTANGVVVGNFGVTLNDQEVADALFNKTNDGVYIDKKLIQGRVAWGTEVTCYSIALDNNGKKGELIKFKYVVPQK